jgi:hypothetical protein
MRIVFNPNFALGRWSRRTMPDFFFLKKFDRSHRYALTFLVEKASPSFALSHAPNAKFGFKKINNKGQAMVETLITTVFLTIIVFAALQLVIMIVNDLSMNEKVFAMSRVAVVSKTAEVDNKMKWISTLFLLPDVKLSGFHFVPYEVPVEGKSVSGSHSGTKAQIYNTSIKYVQSVMFGNLLSGSQIMSIGNVNLIKNTARARMVKSPDEDYYDKAYPGAPNF